MISLKKYTFLSIATALATILIKLIAYFFTHSIGLLSDAIESVVNLVAAVFAFLMIKLAEKPEDKNHPFGHSKAEYFSSLLEGGLIFAAAITIIITAIQRLFSPVPLEKISLGLLFSSVASLINLIVGLKLIQTGKKYHSITLEADGHHLLTDVYTSLGVILAVFFVGLTNILILDPLIAIFVALNILWTGFSLIKKSVLGLIDTAIDKNEIKKIEQILKKHQKKGFAFHKIQTRQSGQKKFISFHLLFPNQWSIKKAHDLAEKIEQEIKTKISNAVVQTHLEPIDDLKSFQD